MKLEDINLIREYLEEKFIGGDGKIRLVFRNEYGNFEQYKVISENVYIFEKYVQVDGSQLSLF